ncbi:LOW QUALITY PROTEIN: phospholipid phosphatase-related protein type 2 [Buteo buteo]|uniref:LOW QUALITY PROTEIN: phospholipid phosphatase-related protein type 2 n=1 Tax=Buteo buteo TaxID=30397 RepID=UPI003EBD9C43
MSGPVGSALGPARPGRPLPAARPAPPLATHWTRRSVATVPLDITALPPAPDTAIGPGRRCGTAPPLCPPPGVFSFGLLATAIFANAGQVVTGAPAPHFLAVCRPNYSALGCAPPAAPPRFVPPGGTPCAGDPPLVAAARRAFPCKEAALGAYAGAYAGLYVTLAWRGGGSRLAKPAAVLGFAAPPFLLGALRVAEHRNHWGDVLAGFLTGTAIAAFLVTCVVGNFQSTGESGQGVGGGVPRAPPELPHPQPPLEEISVTQARRADFPAVT